MSEKIRPQHLARKAILYVRQSSAYQVLHNLRGRSYGTRWKSVCITWNGERLKSMMTWDDRRRLVTRASSGAWWRKSVWGKVGAVAAREVSVSPTTPQWRQLVEVCRVVDTVLIDQRWSTHPGSVTPAFGLRALE